MYNLNGYMTLNGKDAHTEYSAFLCEEKPDDNYNFGELQKPLEMKDYTAVDYRESDGEELPDELPEPRYKARDVTLYMAVYAGGLAACNACRSALIEAIRTGWVTLKVKELPSTYRLYYKGATEIKVLTDVTDGTTVTCFKVKFREPKPGTL